MLFRSIGGTDDIAAVVDIAARHGLYCHVDAAWAGSAMICPEFRRFWAGVEGADSIVFNPHKWLGAQFDCSIQFIRDPESLVRTLAIRPEFLKTHGRDGITNYSEWSVPLGRRFRALKLWFLLRAHGLEGLRTMIRNHVSWSGKLAERLGQEADFEITADDTAAPPRGRFVDRVSEGFRTLRRLPHRVARIRGGWAELGRGRGGWAPRCSLNAATGPRRKVMTVDVGLDGVRAAGRRSGATVNDVLLVAVTGALAELLRERKEFPQELVVSVPVSARSSATSGHLGNQVGVMPVRVPLVGSFQERLTTVSGVTRVQKMRTRGTSSALIGPLFRILAALRLFRWFVDRQRLVNSFLTNLPGPPGQLVIAGAPITGITPITVTAGNVGVAFAALSYAGTLTVTIIVDPDVVPEVRELAAALHEQFRAAIE